MEWFDIAKYILFWFIFVINTTKDLAIAVGTESVAPDNRCNNR